jgi:hypothetical protein
VKLESDQEIVDLKNRLQTEFNEKEEKLRRTFYDNLMTELTNMNSKGNVTTKFMRDIALKLMDKSADLNVNRIETKTVNTTAKEE